MIDALMDSWRRNVAIIGHLAEAVEPGQLELALAEGEMDVAEHLCHIHSTRRWWIAQIEPERLAGTERLHIQHGDDWEAIRDLPTIRERLAESAALVAAIVEEALRTGQPTLGPYDHPVLLMQHLLWHEGWHVGAVLTILRVRGHELPESWEEPHVWALWRGPEEPA